MFNVNFNLLPYRENKKKIVLKEFAIIFIFCGMVAAALWGGSHLFLGASLSNQIERNAILTHAIDDLNKKNEELQVLKKGMTEALSRKEALDVLDNRRTATPLLFSEVITMLPENMYLTALEQKEDLIMIKGVTFSNLMVSTLINHIKDDPAFSEPTLTEIHASTEKGRRLNEFSMTFKIKQLKKEVVVKKKSKNNKDAK